MMLSIHLFFYGIVCPFSGALSDQWKPKRTIILGIVILGITSMACGLAQELWHFYLIFGFITPIGLACLGAPVVTPTIINWFYKSRGLAYGIAQMGGGLSFIYAIFAESMISLIGWRIAYLALGLTIMIVLIPVILVYYAGDPSEKYLKPYGSDDENWFICPKIWCPACKISITEDSIVDDIGFNGKVVIKPVCEGSSVGMRIVEDSHNEKNKLSADVISAIDFCYSVSDRVMIEKYIGGRELTVSILDDNCLPAIEILPKGSFYDYKSKYTKGESEYVVPAVLDTRLEKLLNEYSIKIHKSIGCRGYSRVDFRLSNDGEIYFLEINTLPGFTTTSLFPKAANAAELNYNQLLKNIIRLAVQ